MPESESINGIRLVYDVVNEIAPCYSESPRIKSPDHVETLVRHFQSSGQIPQSREAFCVMALDGRHKPIGFQVVSVGTLTTSLVHPREIFRFAIISGAAAIVVAHTHPTGDPSPSTEDHRATTRLAEAGRLIGIPLLDHVVVGGPGRTFSFRSETSLLSDLGKA